MSTFYIIFMLLLIVLPPVFKGIEKALSNAGQDSRASQVKRMREILFDEEKEDKDHDLDNETCPQVSPRYEGEVFPVYDYISDEAETESETASKETAIPKELLEGGYMSVKEIAEMRKTDNGVCVTASDDQAKSRKIDPRKLVLYSEIMKTKF